MRKVVKTFKGGGMQKIQKKVNKRTKKIESLESNKLKAYTNLANINKKLEKKNMKKQAGKKKSFLGRAMSRLFGTSSKSLRKKQKQLMKKSDAISGKLTKKQTKQGLEIEKIEAIKTGIASATIKSDESKKTAEADAAKIKQLAEAITGPPKILEGDVEKEVGMTEAGPHKPLEESAGPLKITEGEGKTEAEVIKTNNTSAETKAPKPSAPTTQEKLTKAQETLKARQDKHASNQAIIEKIKSGNTATLDAHTPKQIKKIKSNIAKADKEIAQLSSKKTKINTQLTKETTKAEIQKAIVNAQAKSNANTLAFDTNKAQKISNTTKISDNLIAFNQTRLDREKKQLMSLTNPTDIKQSQNQIKALETTIKNRKKTTKNNLKTITNTKEIKPIIVAPTPKIVSPAATTDATDVEKAGADAPPPRPPKRLGAPLPPIPVEAPAPARPTEPKQNLNSVVPQHQEHREDHQV